MGGKMSRCSETSWGELLPLSYLGIARKGKSVAWAQKSWSYSRGTTSLAGFAGVDRHSHFPKHRPQWGGSASLSLSSFFHQTQLEATPIKSAVKKSEITWYSVFSSSRSGSPGFLVLCWLRFSYFNFQSGTLSSKIRVEGWTVTTIPWIIPYSGCGQLHHGGAI
jgi:hypothetical protein